MYNYVARWKNNHYDYVDVVIKKKRVKRKEKLKNFKRMVTSI